METVETVQKRSVVTDPMCPKWFAKFHAGHFLLDDAPWLGRPAEVDSDQIKTLIENNQHYTMGEIANILQISKSIKLLLKMKNVSFILWKKLNPTQVLCFGPTQHLAFFTIHSAFGEQHWLLRNSSVIFSCKRLVCWEFTLLFQSDSLPIRSQSLSLVSQCDGNIQTFIHWILVKRQLR